MKKNRLVLGLVVLIVLLFQAFIAFWIFTDRERARIVARVKKPEAMVRYEELAVAGEAEKASVAAAPLQAGVSETDTDVQVARETMARYERFFARKLEQFDQETWDDLYDNILTKEDREWSAEELAALRTFLSAHRDFIREIRALAERGGPVHPLDFSNGFEMDMSHLAKLREWARILRVDALVSAKDGLYEEAVKDIVAGMQLADALGEEPILISQLVSIAMHGIMYDAVQRTFDANEFSPHLASELMRQAARGDGREAFANSFLTEQSVGLDGISQIFAQGWEEGARSLQDILQGPMMDLSWRTWAGIRLYTSPLARPWQNMDMEDFADIMGRQSVAARLVFYEAQPLLDQIDQDIEDLPFTRLMSRILTPALTRANLSQARHEAHLDLMQLGIALEQYYVLHGEYPATLEAVADDLGGGIPVDPHTGDPYYYRPQGETFLLYSVGMNLTDDGGVHNFREGDMVWRGDIQPKRLVQRQGHRLAQATQVPIGSPASAVISGVLALKTPSQGRQTRSMMMAGA